MKLNNKGFAITTALYGTLVLFLMLSMASLGMMGTYKARMDKLIDEDKGAMCIITKECNNDQNTSNECTKKTQYFVQTCAATANNYYCSSGQIWWNEVCLYESSKMSDVTSQSECGSSYTWVPGKGCYNRGCNPATSTNGLCGGKCTIGVCACGTWNTGIWQDTNCGSLNNKQCKVSATREVCVD